MSAYVMTPLSLNGVTIIAGSVRAAYWNVGDPSPLTAGAPIDPVEANIPGLGQQDVRGQPGGTNWLLTVELTATDETDLQALHTLFNERLGSVYLRCTDGAGSPATWRVLVRQLGPAKRVSPAVFKVAFRVADPRWQQNAATTDNQLAKQTSPISPTLTNAGNRQARSLFTITANAAKSVNSMLSDYTASLQGFIVNRTPNDIVNKPAYLFDISGGASRFGTDTSPTGTTVQKTTGNTTLAGALSSSATTIPLTSAAGFNVNGGLAVITWVTGQSYGTMECVSYAGVSGNSLTGCVRGLGGTTAQAHNNLDRVDLCGTMPNGDDVRVWLDDVPDVPRYIVTWNSPVSPGSDVAINVSLPAASAYTLVAAMTPAVPANGASFAVNEDISRLAPKGFLVIGDEVFYYASKSGRTFLGIQRGAAGANNGLWGGTTAAHALGASVWANPRHYVVACGYATATPPPAPLSQRPAIQLKGSSNQSWLWGDQADDASTIYFDRNYPDRSAQWVPGFDLDGNTISPLMSLSASGNIATFKDDVPGDGNPPYNFLELSVPMGIKKADANAVKNDWTPSAEVLKLELFTRDAGGTLKLLDSLLQSAVAAARALPAVLAATAYGLKLKCRYCVTTGHRGTGTPAVISNTTSLNGNQWAQRFTLQKATLVESIEVSLWNTGAGTQAVMARITADNGGKPSNIDIWPTDTQISVTNQTPTLYKITPEIPMLLDAGVYWLVLLRTGANVVTVNWDARGGTMSPYVGNRYTHGVFGTWDATTFGVQPGDQGYFLINGVYANDGSSPINDDQPVRAVTTALRTGITASFDKTIILIEPLQAIYVNRTGAFSALLFHASGLLTNTTTGDTIAYDKWMPLTATLAVDCDARTVTYTETAVTYPVTKAITPSNTADWSPMNPGANAYTYVDAGLIAPASMDFVSVYRGVKV